MKYGLAILHDLLRNYETYGGVLLLVKVSTLAYWGLILTLLLSENFLSLIGSGQTIMGIPIIDSVLIIAVIWIIAVTLHYKDTKRVKYRFKWIMVFAIILVLFSSIQSYRLYGQDIFLGIRPQRYFLVWALSYFPIRKLMANDILSYEKIEHLIYKIGIAEICLYLAQFFLRNTVTFLAVKKNDVYSSTRYYISTILICLLIFICLDKIFKKEKIVFNSVVIAAALVVILMVGKMRLNFISVAGAIVIGIALWRKGGSAKMLFLIMGVVFAALICNTEVIQSILPAINRTGQIDTLAIRDVGREFYLKTFYEHPVLGAGYINTQWRPAYVAARAGEGISWVDNGVFGILFFYGGIGLLWVLSIFRKIYKYAYRLLKNGVYLFFVMPLYWLIGCINEAHWYWSNFLILVIFVCLMEDVIDSCEEAYVAYE